MKTLHEQYRPQAWSDVVGQDKAIARFRTVAKRGIGGRCFWITGKSGTGKTTIARLIARELADPFCIEESNAQDLSIGGVRDLERAMHLYGMGEKTGRAWIFNEAHRMRTDVVTRLLTTLEELPDHCIVIFTTTLDGDALFDDVLDSSPLLSRCVRIPLSQQGLAKAFAERACTIAQTEGLDGKPIEQYVRLVNKHGANLRAVLQSVEAGEMLE